VQCSVELEVEGVIIINTDNRLRLLQFTCCVCVITSQIADSFASNSINIPIRIINIGKVESKGSWWSGYMNTCVSAKNGSQEYSLFRSHSLMRPSHSKIRFRQDSVASTHPRRLFHKNYYHYCHYISEEEEPAAFVFLHG
jgi:hypothetical protein